MADTPRGATPDDWFHFDFVLGLGSNLLPCVPAAPDVKVAAGSALEGKVGKIPSQFNRNGEAHGLTEWQKRSILSNEIELWRKDPRLNICIRTGPISGVYALDVDIEDLEKSETVFQIIQAMVGRHPRRRRENSSKFLIPFLMAEPCKKRKIKLDNSPRGAAIELLADGQQFVAAGSHSSGVRYQWRPGLPEQLPTLTMDQLNSLWTTLTTRYQDATTKTSSPQGSQTAQAQGQSQSQQQESSVLTEIADADWQELLNALRFMLDKVQDNDRWSEVGYALLSLQGTRPIAQLWRDFSRKAVGYTEGADEQWWATHHNQTPRSDYRHIFKMARQRGLQRVADVSAFPPVPSAASGPDGSESTDAGQADVVPPPLPSKTIVRIVDDQFDTIVAQLETIIKPHVYVQGPHLVRTSEAHADAEIRRDEDALMLIMATKAWAKVKYSELCTFQRFASAQGNWYNVGPSSEHINAVLELGGWKLLRPLDAIARSPFVRFDGSICDTPGYDPISRVLYVPGTTFPGIPSNPDQSAALAALERIRAVFDQFPWKESASESAFLAHVLSEAGRLAIDRCPMFFYDAPKAGTGKGLLQEMAARIVHGTEPAIRPWVGDGDEIRKSLYASLLAGDRSLWFDNVPNGHKVRSPELCAFITSSTWKDRKLGESETTGVPNKTVLVASGNNITPVSDLARRSLVIRMDANTERMNQRVFKHEDLRSYVMANRAELLVDALTIMKAYHATGGIAGMPVALPSFERWSRLCRDPLIWLGLPDPVITQNETDDETGNIGEIFERLAEQFGDREFTGTDVARIVNGITDSNGDLAGALQTNGCSEPNSPLKVGYWLRGCRDQISHGYKLMHVKSTARGVKWCLKRMNEDLT